MDTVWAPSRTLSSRLLVIWGGVTKKEEKLLKFSNVWGGALSALYIHVHNPRKLLLLFFLVLLLLLMLLLLLFMLLLLFVIVVVINVNHRNLTLKFGQNQ